MKKTQTPAAMLTVEDFVALQTTSELNAFWQSLLSDFVKPQCNGVGFSDLKSAADLSNFVCFTDWQPPWIGKASLEIERTLPATGPTTMQQVYDVFELGDEVMSRLLRIDFDEWAITSDAYPADRLCFLSDGDILLKVEPYEGTLLFCANDAKLAEALQGIEPNPMPYFDRSRDWKVRSWIDPR